MRAFHDAILNTNEKIHEVYSIWATVLVDPKTPIDARVDARNELGYFLGALNDVERRARDVLAAFIERTKTKKVVLCAKRK